MIETERLRIYPASKTQMEAIISAQTDDELKAAYSMMLEGCMNHPDKWEWFALWVIELHSGENVGGLCFKGLDANGVAEIGYGISDSYQRNGYATEAVRAVCAWAFGNPDVTCIEAETDAGNTASQRVLEKCGFIASGKIGGEGSVFILPRVLDRKIIHA